jgi:hypothetical protein
MELTLDTSAPEFQKAAELGKVRSDIELLPDKALQQIRVVGETIDDLRSG